MTAIFLLQSAWLCALELSWHHCMSQNWANRTLPRVKSKARRLCESAPHISRPWRGHSATAGFRLHLFRCSPMPSLRPSAGSQQASPPSCKGTWPPWAEKDRVSAACLLPGGWTLGWQAWRDRVTDTCCFPFFLAWNPASLWKLRHRGVRMFWTAISKVEMKWEFCQLLIIWAWEQISSFCLAGTASSIKWGA